MKRLIVSIVMAGLPWVAQAQAASVPLIAAQSQAQNQAQTPLPPESFFGRPMIESARISPSGRWLAISSGRGVPRVGIVIFDVQSMKTTGVAASFSDADIGDLYWVDDDRLIFDVQDNQRGGSDQRFWPGLYSVRRDGSELRQLISTTGLRMPSWRVAREPLSVNHALLHVPQGEGTEVLIGEWVQPGGADVPYVIAKRLDVVTGRTRNLSFGAPDHVRWWMFDAKGEARLVFTRRGGRGAYHWREADDKPWRLLAEFDVLNPPWNPRFLDGKGGLYVSAARGEGGVSQLFAFDFATGKPAAEPVISTPGFDLLGGLVSETANSPVLGVRVVTDAETTVWFEPRLKALQGQIDELMPGHINRISCRRCLSDDVAVLVYSWSDRDPGQYHVYRGSDKKWLKVSDVRPEIDASRMGSTSFDRVRMRDGLETPVWVTRPAGPAAGPWPAVVLVHGGPWVRGRTWAWSAQAQFLASRGYVVIEPEFRGSRGYGGKLYRAGWRQWGGTMQDDLVDALSWAVDKGWADKDRVCIAGGSYGGYATLMGLIKHPEQFRCGSAWMAVTDPRLLYKWTSVSDLSDESRDHDYPTLVGDPVADLAMLEAATPVLHAKRIKAPVMLVVGVDDRRVPLEHGQRMRAALTEAGNPPQWLAYLDEGHGIFLTKNQLDFARKLEAFLATNLKPR